MKTRKELKEEYKNRKPRMGVFLIRNKQSNRVLLDFSTDIPAKWNRHRTELNFGNHRNRSLQADWNEAGEANFSFEVVTELKTREGERVDYRDELRVLKDMVSEEMELGESDMY